MNIVFALLFEEKAVRTAHTGYFLPKLEVKGLFERNLFDQPLWSYLKTYENIWKIMTGQSDAYATDYLRYYPYFKKYYTMIAMDVNKQQAVDADQKAI